MNWNRKYRIFTVLGIILLVAGIFVPQALIYNVQDKLGIRGYNQIIINAGPGIINSSQSSFLSEEAHILSKSLNVSEYAYAAGLSGLTADISAKNQNVSYDVSLVGTNGKYSSFLNFEFICGGYFKDSAEARGGNVIIIGENVAHRFFKNTDVVGLELYINGVPYQIAGVYRESPDLFHIMAEGVASRVYMPFTALQKLFPDVQINTLYLSDKNDSNEKISNVMIEGALNYVGKSVSDYKITSLSEQAQIMSRKPQILMFLAGLFIILFLLKLIWRLIGEIKQVICVNYQDKYVLGALRLSANQILITAIKMAALGAAVYLVYSQIKFKLYVSPAAIPVVLTDIGHYFRYAWQLMVEQCALNGYVYTSAENYIRIANTMITILFFAGLLVGFGSLCLGKIFYAQSKLELNFWREIILFSILIPTVIAISTLIGVTGVTVYQLIILLAFVMIFIFKPTDLCQT